MMYVASTGTPNAMAVGSRNSNFGPVRRWVLERLEQMRGEARKFSQDDTAAVNRAMETIRGASTPTTETPIVVDFDYLSMRVRVTIRKE